MERVDYRETRMHNNASRSHLTDLECQRIKSNQFRDDSDIPIKKVHALTRDQNKNDNDQKQAIDFSFGNTRFVETRNETCTICHLNILNTSFNNTDESQCAFACPQGHLLCYGCVQQFGIRLDIGCIFCGVKSRYSTRNFSQEQRVQDVKRVQDQQQQQQQMPHNEDVYSNLRVRYQESEAIENNNSPDAEHGSLWRSNPDEMENADEKCAEVRNKQCQQRSCYNVAKHELQPTASEGKLNLNGQIFSEYSRRPIRCPRVDCAVNVAFSALTHHFLFDHPEVPILCVDPGVKSTLIVSFAALTRDISRCLALLLVSGKLPLLITYTFASVRDPAARLFNGSQISTKYRNRLPLPVLAARLGCNGCNISPCDVHASGEGQCKGDIVIAWVAGLDIGNTTDTLRCSIQAVDDVENNGFRSLTYTGPVNSLRTAQRPREVFSTGDCIVLHEGLIGRITSGCTSLNVNVIVH